MKTKSYNALAMVFYIALFLVSAAGIIAPLAMWISYDPYTTWGYETSFYDSTFVFVFYGDNVLHSEECMAKLVLNAFYFIFLVSSFLLVVFSFMRLISKDYNATLKKAQIIMSIIVFISCLVILFSLLSYTDAYGEYWTKEAVDESIMQVKCHYKEHLKLGPSSIVMSVISFLSMLFVCFVKDNKKQEQE